MFTERLDTINIGFENTADKRYTIGVVGNVVVPKDYKPYKKE